MIFHIGTSEGLAWEIEQLIRQGNSERIVVYFGSQLRGKPDQTVLYREFFERFNKIFPKGLPVEPGDSTFITFDPDWMPVLSSEL